MFLTNASSLLTAILIQRISSPTRRIASIRKILYPLSWTPDSGQSGRLFGTKPSNHPKLSQSPNMHGEGPASGARTPPALPAAYALRAEVRIVHGNEKFILSRTAYPQSQSSQGIKKHFFHIPPHPPERLYRPSKREKNKKKTRLRPRARAGELVAPPRWWGGTSGSPHRTGLGEALCRLVWPCWVYTCHGACTGGWCT